MIERSYILETADPVIFYGVNNSNMQLIKTLFPKPRVVARGNVMKVIGEEESALFLRKIREVENYREEFNALSEDVILDIIKGKGPVGLGKTFVAIALAVRALKNKVVRKIILSRPAVEAGEKPGLLPGEMKDKLDPYLQPLYDALQDMIPAARLREYMEGNVIQIAPLAFMRGRTLNDAVVICFLCYYAREDGSLALRPLFFFQMDA